MRYYEGAYYIIAFIADWPDLLLRFIDDLYQNVKVFLMSLKLRSRAQVRPQAGILEMQPTECMSLASRATAKVQKMKGSP